MPSHLSIVNHNRAQVNHKMQEDLVYIMAETANMMDVIRSSLYTESCEESSLSPKQRYIESLMNRYKNKRALFGLKINPNGMSDSFVRTCLQSKNLLIGTR